MLLTENDKLFLQQLRIVSKQNQESENKTIVTNKELISNELLELFEAKGEGAWFFDVYVEFEPMFKEKPAKDWQQKQGVT